MAGDHEIVKCSCGAIIMQCRCFHENKPVRVVQHGCDGCKGKATVDEDTRPTPPASTTSRLMPCPACDTELRGDVINSVVRYSPTADELLEELAGTNPVETIDPVGHGLKSTSRCKHCRALAPLTERLHRETTWHAVECLWRRAFMHVSRRHQRAERAPTWPTPSRRL